LDELLEERVHCCAASFIAVSRMDMSSVTMSLDHDERHAPQAKKMRVQPVSAR